MTGPKFDPRLIPSFEIPVGTRLLWKSPPKNTHHYVSNDGEATRRMWEAFENYKNSDTLISVIWAKDEKDIDEEWLHLGTFLEDSDG